MSQWTHIAGVLDIDSFISKETKENIEKYFETLPKIDGSEGDVEYYINVLNGYNSCEWNGGVQTRYQSRVTVSLIGDLRNRSFDSIEKNLEIVLNSVCRKFLVRNGCVTINDEWLDKIVLYYYNGPEDNFCKIVQSK